MSTHRKNPRKNTNVISKYELMVYANAELMISILEAFCLLLNETIKHTYLAFCFDRYLCVCVCVFVCVCVCVCEREREISPRCEET